MQPGLVLVYGEPKRYRQRRPVRRVNWFYGRATLPVVIGLFIDQNQARLHRPYEEPNKGLRLPQEFIGFAMSRNGFQVAYAAQNINKVREDSPKKDPGRINREYNFFQKWHIRYGGIPCLFLDGPIAPIGDEWGIYRETKTIPMISAMINL
jgi:hypothetical protein